jgi:adenylosuccinate lyase
MCCELQKILLEVRAGLGQADKKHVAEVEAALKKISTLNIALLEEQVTKHDQLAVIEEIGRFVSPATKALLHPGTTSYDILDTSRSVLFKQAWKQVIRPEICKAIETLCGLSERSMDVLQVGRTHLQDTSPILFGGTLASYAARLAERVLKTDAAFADLRGKISGIVGTGASVDMVIGNSLAFEQQVLERVGLQPDLTATQIVQKERLSDVGHQLTSLMHVLADFANDMRILYSSAIGEVTSRDNAQRLGGSSADAGKNNPIQYENIAGKAVVIEAAMRLLYSLIQSDLQRDLRGSVVSRYQPQAMMVQLYEAFVRLNEKALPQLSVNEDRMAANLVPITQNPTEAMVAILRGEPSWVHASYGVGHDFVQEMARQAKKAKQPLLTIALQDAEFKKLYDGLPENKQAILSGKLELYTGSARERAEMNRTFARSIL